MRVTDEAIDRIKQMIVAGELRPGDRLPREADLAARLGLSRNSLREAVKALALIRVLEVRQGDGTFVTSLDPSLLMETMGFVLDLHQDASVLEFFEVRRILEPAAAARAALRMADDDIAALRKMLDELGPEPSVEDLLTSDVEFHKVVALGSGNRALASIIDSLRQPTYRARIWRGLTQSDAVTRTLAEHRAILDAIEGREPEVARSWATVHIAGVERWIQDAVNLDEPDRGGGVGKVRGTAAQPELRKASGGTVRPLRRVTPAEY
jgi:GntR family transcriptional regulator, transcriptional repressor for pyruvate dehydrogenase complex